MKNNPLRRILPAENAHFVVKHYGFLSNARLTALLMTVYPTELNSDEAIQLISDARTRSLTKS